MKSRYFLFAGEVSGDLHGSHIIQSLLSVHPNAHLCGVGGPLMRKEQFECLIQMEEFQVMGFSDVVKALPHLWKQFFRVRDLIIKERPDVVILIDYPGFNLRLARALRKRGYEGKIVQFICPSVWAHGKGRIQVLADNYDLVLSIYPFEAAYFAHTPLKVTYIGNPLQTAIQAHAINRDWKEKTGLPEREMIALFPGSRKGEIQLHVPLQLQAAAQLHRRYPHFIFVLSCAQPHLQQDLTRLVEKGPLRLNEELFIVPASFRYELMQSAQAALAKSGTVTLELALHSIPTVVHYELSFLNYLFAKFILRLNLPHYCIVNILANKTLFPELMGRHISPNDLHHHLEALLFNASLRNEIVEGCAAMQRTFGNLPSYQRAALAIEELTGC